MTAVGKCCFGLTPLFSAFHAYPKYWLKDEEGNLIYGSVQKEVREALKTLAELYKEGVLDQKIFLRQDVLEVLNEGKAGIFFGPGGRQNGWRRISLKIKANGRHTEHRWMRMGSIFV